MTFDVLIRGGTVFDGSGAVGVRADVAIERGRVVAIEPGTALTSAQAALVVDAVGRYVAPGFIDIHTHSDRSILINGRMESKIRQGVTTEVAGNCGSGVAPALGPAAAQADASGEIAHENKTWPTMGAYFEEIERSGIAGNYCTWVGHGTLRASTVGYEMRPPTEDELEHMRRLLRESLEAGAFGFSTGLIYAPSGFAQTDEIAALAAVARESEGLYASHIRNESSKLLEAVGEAIEIGRRGGVPVQVAHHKASGRPNWGLVGQSLALMDRARAEGVDVACDQYPYVASSTGLTSILPKWALEGGRETIVARLRDGETRARLREEMLASRPDYAELREDQGWHGILIARCRGDRSVEGRRLGEVAVERNVDPFELAFDLLVASDGTVPCIFFSMCEPDVRTVMGWAHTMIGSDASSVAPYGPLGEGRPHPRAYGTFARVLGRYVREQGVLKWEAALHKMTGQPAARLGLKQRGFLRTGQWADVVVFDPQTVQDEATFVEPHRFASGIDHVLVNGVPVVRNGEHTGATPGRVLRRGVDA
ncbi:MAG TPA: D-aminoacylase [Chloroflexota bacterium]|nr:D-aminoacylase [Chloroflexota bacterium]